MFDLQCKKCKMIHRDVIIPKYHKTLTMKNNWCNNCKGIRFETLAPLCAMQPDSMWSGQQTQFGYFTSKSQYEQTLKDKNFATIDKKELDTYRNKVYNTRQDSIKKQRAKTNEFLAEQLASVEISPDGNTVKERNKYARKRQ